MLHKSHNMNTVYNIKYLILFLNVNCHFYFYYLLDILPNLLLTARIRKDLVWYCNKLCIILFIHHHDLLS